MPCQATPEAHCCWIDGELCRFFDLNADPSTVGFEGYCTLRTELGNWRRVHRDLRYNEVRVALRARAVTVDCGDWTPPGVCRSCGWDGS